jgi:hypothetical protein
MYEELLQKCRRGEYTIYACVITDISTMSAHVFVSLTHQVNSLREIQAIKRLSPHRNIIVLEEVLFDPPSGRLALVFELMEGNLYELMKGESSARTIDIISPFY